MKDFVRCRVKHVLLRVAYCSLAGEGRDLARDGWMSDRKNSSTGYLALPIHQSHRLPEI
jgi:hypothetical protein